MNESGIANGGQATLNFIDSVRLRAQLALRKQPTSITSAVVDGRGEIRISWTHETYWRRVEIVITQWKSTAPGDSTKDFSDALELIKNSTTTSDSRSETDE